MTGAANNRSEIAGLAPETARLVVSFRSTTNSYKHLLFRAILRAVVEGEGPRLPYDRLLRLMLEEAWWPAFHFRLSLGLQDLVAERLDRLVADPDDWRRRPEEVRSLLAALPVDLSFERRRGLLRFVPQRLIAPWFEAELTGVSDGSRDRAIERLSNELFAERAPLYRIEAHGLEMHERWMDALRAEAALFQGWSDAAWLRFLEARNPHATSLAVKVRPGFLRGGLSEERRLWAEVAGRMPVACIYSGAPVEPGGFAVDHVLPFAFTGHDRFWNLSPIAPELNSAKRDRLPPLDAIPRLARQHVQLWRGAGALPARAQAGLRRLAEEYVIDLGLPPDSLGDEGAMTGAFVESYGSLLVIARRMGFPRWESHPG